MAIDRQRNFERVFFFLCLSLFLFYSGSLLLLNAQIYYGQPPIGLRGFVVGDDQSRAVPVSRVADASCTWNLRRLAGCCTNRRWKWVVAAVFLRRCVSPDDPSISSHQIAPGIRFRVAGRFAAEADIPHIYHVQPDLVHHMGVSILAKHAGKGPERQFYGFLGGGVCGCRVWVIGAVCISVDLPLSRSAREMARRFAGVAPVVPLARDDLSRLAAQFFADRAAEESGICGFGDISRAVVFEPGAARERLAGAGAAAGSFGVDFVVRAGSFIEPLQRALGRTLQETAHREMERVQRLMAEIQQEAKQGDIGRLVRFVERRLTEEFELASARVILGKRFAARTGVWLKL